MLRRYWFEFVDGPAQLPPGLGIGCGVTAIDRQDAERLIERRVFCGSPLPRLLRVVEDVDIATLDRGHVVPNMRDPVRRGVWFPIGYD